MRAIWSFWSKPFAAHRYTMWPSETHHLYSWVLSVETARQHYPDTWLVTDDAGARLLVDGLGLQFKRVTTDLNALAQHDPDWWNLGKLYAYHLQTEPFVHLDSDVFLWKRLPGRLERADVFAEHYYSFYPAPHYQPDRLERYFRSMTGCWLPEEWVSYGRTLNHQRAEACGIVGGNRTDFISRYAAASLRWVTESRNQEIIRSFPNKRVHIGLIEEYALTVFVESYRTTNALPLGSVNIQHVLSSDADRWDPDRAAQVGYTHPIGALKRNPSFAGMLERTVRRDYPQLYARCVKLANTL